eukprot:TRINITY_DN30089_c0_g1_i1.p1 TRINITY_DN30089_c0_g1~~TRINITY_DN30089_c0_g1_i1.p1  ORF type:complete len:1092 (+),score=273.24 TRINITY_DN30089_c0_g1_i1:33-3278(+)
MEVSRAIHSQVGRAARVAMIRCSPAGWHGSPPALQEVLPGVPPVGEGLAGRARASSKPWAQSAIAGAVALTCARRGRHLRSRKCVSSASGFCRSFHSGRSSSSRAVRATATAAPAETATKVWTVDEVRQAYIDFFTEKKAHEFIKSSPVVPLNDPTLLFANAGMNQFKPIFLGQLEPNSPLQGVTRAANSQKCIRAGGKHNDLDDVGRDVYHHTFFEMLGNWSFGDYFKVEAIDWAWELLTQVYGLDPDRLYASYFAGDEELGLPADDEAKALWERYLPPSRVLPFDKSDNFWEMGAVGPCGPCSELHYDRIGGRDAAALVNADDPDVIEIWNLVFMQFYREDGGKLTTLPNQHIDTGMGLERIVSVLQDKRSNYDTDCFEPLLNAVHDQVGGEKYQGRLGAQDPDMRDTAYRVIVDHARTLTLAVSDGALPSSEGRGYVLRRILRRAVRYGRQKLSAPPGFFSKLVPAVVTCLSPAYPELAAAAERVQAVLSEEEVAFDRTVDRGMQYFESLKAEVTAAGNNVLPGDQAFLLYDSMGFPLDLTEQMADEAGFTVDVAGFEAAMEGQKERSRAALREQQALEKGMQTLELVAEQTAWLAGQGIPITDDSQKYTWDVQPTARVLAIFSQQGFLESTGELSDEGASVGIVLDSTSFYAEAGGQVGDVGMLCKDGEKIIDIKATEVFAGYVLHSGVPTLPLQVGDEVCCQVDYDHRGLVAPNHTMTHVLNWALREVLGEGVDQRGSLVNAQRLRFDFSYEASSGVSASDLQRVEALVQSVVEDGLPVTSKDAPLAEAQAIRGLRAVAGESYPDPVRVVTVGKGSVTELLEKPSEEAWLGQSVEFCGGTHLTSTSEAGAFVILEEKGISKGVRRIIAATGEIAREAAQEGERLQDRLAALEAGDVPEEQVLLELGQQLDNRDLSASLKADCRERLGKLRKQLKKAQKKKKGGKVGKEELQAARNAVLQAVNTAREAGAVHCVVLWDGPGLDGKVLREMAQQPELAETATLVLTTPGGGRVDCFAAVPEACQSKGGAGAWLQAAVAPLGGKGGGNASFAQGAAKTDDKAALLAAEEAAKAFWNAAS